MKRIPPDLIKVRIPEENAVVARRRIASTVRAHVDDFSPYQAVKPQMEAAAFDCYVQGLMDGYQLGMDDNLPMDDILWPTPNC